MRKKRCYGIYLIWVGLSLWIALEPGWAAPKKQSQAPVNQERQVMSPKKLPEMLAATTAKLENSIAEVKKQQEIETQALEDEMKQEADLKSRIAALTASMAVKKLSLAGAKEALQNLSSEEKQITSHLKKIEQQQQALDTEIPNQAEALATVKDQVDKLAKLNRQVNRSENLIKGYQDYLRKAQEYDTVARNYQEILGKTAASLQRQMELLEHTESKIEKEYLEKALKQELLQRQSFTSRLHQIGQSLGTLAKIPGKAQAWLVGVHQSGALADFAEENLANLVGLGLLLAVLGVGTHFLKRLVLPGLVDWQKHSADVNLKGFLTLSQILMEHLFSVGFVLWLYLAFWRLEVISSKVAWLVWSLVATLVGLRLALKLIQCFFSGKETGGVLSLSGDLARYYRVHLKLLAAYFFLLNFFVIANAPELGLSPEVAGNLKTIFQTVLLGWVLWLLGGRRLEKVLTALPLPAFFKNKTFLRVLRSAAFLTFAFMVIFGLLGFKFLFEYLAQGAAFTVIVLALAWVLGGAAAAVLRLLLHPEVGALARKYPGQNQLFLRSYRIILHTLKIALAGLAVVLSLNVWGFPLERMDRILEWLQKGPTVGAIHLTPANIGLTVLIFYLGFRFSRLLSTFLEQKYYPRKNWDAGVQYTISRTTHYVILVITVLLAMHIMGITFTSLALVAGALGVGIGFGLQNIVSNFLSGLILLFERPIKVGDMLIIDGQWGMVKEIRVRSTIFQTFDRYFLIIPNSDLISGKILNWTYAGWGLNRLTIKVGVSYDSDPRKVTKIIEEVCRANERVVPEPPPQVFFEAYGDSSLNFNVWVHLLTPGDRIPATHELNSAIFEAFQKHGIEIPFPQRDLHVRSWAPGAVPNRFDSGEYPESLAAKGSQRPVWNG